MTFAAIELSRSALASCEKTSPRIQIHERTLGHCRCKCRYPSSYCTVQLCSFSPSMQTPGFRSPVSENVCMRHTSCGSLPCPNRFSVIIGNAVMREVRRQKRLVVPRIFLPDADRKVRAKDLLRASKSLMILFQQTLVRRRCCQ